jgi:hypothetical protein
MMRTKIIVKMMSTRAAMIGMTISRRRDGCSGLGVEEMTGGAGCDVAVGTRRLDVSIMIVPVKNAGVAAA